MVMIGMGVSAMMWPCGYGAGWGWTIGGWVMMVAFWGLAIVGIVALVRALGDRCGRGEVHHTETPSEILRRRYAAGEITKEQFEEMMRNAA